MSHLEIVPFKKSHTFTVSMPGSKSISNRALVLASLCNCEVKLKGVLVSEDVELMKEALISMGVQINEEKNGKTLLVRGCEGKLPFKEQSLKVGNAGTVARFLTALLATQKEGVFHLDGSSAMRLRPMNELTKSLETMGCKFSFSAKPGCFPFTMHTNGLQGKVWSIDATKSSQVLSALLMIAPLINRGTCIRYEGGTVSEPFVGITTKMINSFSRGRNCRIASYDNEIEIHSEGYSTEDFEYHIEPDATAASYFLTLPIATGGSCLAKGISTTMLQGDSAYIGILEKLGFNISSTQGGTLSSLPAAAGGGESNFNKISDTFLTILAVSPLLTHDILVRGIGHTRKQETDRVSAMAKELRKLGQNIEEGNDYIWVRPDLNKLRDAVGSMASVSTYDDHRFAMSFAILGCHDLFDDGRPWLSIKDHQCCSKTFPNFFEVLDGLRKGVGK